MTTRRPWTGGIAAGSREFTPAEEQRVVNGLLNHKGHAKRTSLDDFCREVGIDGRTVRAVYQKHDGVTFVLHLQGDGELYVAEFQDEAERTTRQLLSRASKLRARAMRRAELTAGLPRRQGLLFDTEPDDDDDGDEW